jgi:chromosome segregation ATPase
MSAAMLQGAVSTAELAVTEAAAARTQVRQAVASNQAVVRARRTHRVDLDARIAKLTHELNGLQLEQTQARLQLDQAESRNATLEEQLECVEQVHELAEQHKDAASNTVGFSSFRSVRSRNQ